MRGGLTERTVVAGGLLALVIGAAFAILLSSVADLRADQRRSLQSEGVLVAANRLERLVIDLETAQRGFLLTGQEEFLEPWTAARTEYPDQAATLQQLLTGGDPDQRARAGRIVRAAGLVPAGLLDPHRRGRAPGPGRGAGRSGLAAGQAAHRRHPGGVRPVHRRRAGSRDRARGADRRRDPPRDHRRRGRAGRVGRTHRALHRLPDHGDGPAAAPRRGAGRPARRRRPQRAAARARCRRDRCARTQPQHDGRLAAARPGRSGQLPGAGRHRRRPGSAEDRARPARRDPAAADLAAAGAALGRGGACRRTSRSCGRSWTGSRRS